ncbi:MAG: ankyrin repeat domain-containing protein [Planctomycetota bacterium]
MNNLELQVAITSHDMEQLKKLVESGVDISSEITSHGMTPLRYAVSWNQGLKYLIKQGADINYQAGDFGTTALMEAAMHEHLKATQILIEAGADVNLKSFNKETALYHACAGSTKTSQKIAFMLIDAGADILGDKTMPIITVAASHSNPEVIQRLIDEGADVNTHSKMGVCPLYKAIIWKQKKNIEVLLAHGADPLYVVPTVKKFKEGTQYPPDFGKNMIEVAEDRGTRPIVKLLQEAAANKK